MKEYEKPYAEVIDFAAEKIMTIEGGGEGKFSEGDDIIP